MYKLLIVDDEAILREGLRKTILWTELGFEIVGEAEDGEDALNKLALLKPDVVLTDIRMPGMDGLSMAEAVAERFKTVKVVILSGFEEFSYAKRGLELGVFAYISKLTLDTDIKVIFARLKEKLDEEKKAEGQISSIFSESRKLHQQHFFTNLLNGDGIKTEAWQDQKIDFEKACFCIVYVYLETYKEDEDILFGDLISSKRLSDIFGEQVCIIEKGRDIIAVHYDNEHKREKIISGWATLCNVIKQSQRCYAKIIIGSRLEGCQNIEEEYEGIKKCAFAYSMNPVTEIILKDKEQTNTSHSFVSVEQGNQLIRLISEGDTRNVSSKLEELKNQYVAKEHGSEGFKQFALELIGMCSFKLREMGLGCQGHDENISVAYRAIQKTDSVGKLFIQLKNQVTMITQAIAFERKKPAEQAIEIAQEYISNHFYEKITLKDVADIVYLSPTYFSAMFKKYCGKSFMEYLSELRMKRAKELLASGTTVTQTAAFVGYSDMKHFGKLFKKYNNGQNPSDIKYKGKD